MERNYSKGFTLIELMVCFALAAILAGYAIPTMQGMLKRSQGTAAINWLVGSVAYTRNAAITFDTYVTICPSSDGHHCGGAWHDGTIVFTDANLDHRIDGDDTLLRRFTYPLAGGTITWRAFQNRHYLQMTGIGYTHFQNGNFVYCPDNGDLHYAEQLVINIQGRAKTSVDINGDGLVEDRYGHHLRC